MFLIEVPTLMVQCPSSPFLFPDLHVRVFKRQVKLRRQFQRTDLKWLVPVVSFCIFAVVATMLRTCYTLEDVDKWALLSTSFTHVIDGSMTWNDVLQTSTHAFTPIYPALMGFLMFLAGTDNYLEISIVISLAATTGSVIIAAVLSRNWIVTALYATATALMFDAAGWQETMPLAVFASSVYLLVIVKDKTMLAIPAGLLLVFTREILWPLLLVPPILCIFRTGRKWREFLLYSLCYTVIPVLIYAAWVVGSGASNLMPVRYERVAWWNWQRSPINFVVSFLIATGPLSMVLLRANRFSRKDETYLIFIAIFLLSRLVLDGPFLYQYFEPMILAVTLLWKHGAKERFIVLGINIILVFAIEFLALISWVNAMMNFMTGESVFFGPPIVEG